MKRTVLVLAVLLSSRLATADRPKSCPDEGEILISGACVPRQVAQKDSLIARYQQALDELADKPKHAFELFDAACKSGHGPSCTQLGRMYETSRGRVVPKNAAKAQELFDLACTRGDGPGCRLRGMIDLNASQQLSDQNKLKSARKYLDLACARDEAFACSMLGKLLEYDYGGPADPKRSTAVLDKAKGVYARRCSLDEKKGKRDGEVCWQLGYVIEMGYGMDKSAPRTQRAYQLACEANHGAGCMKYIDVLRDAGKRTADLLPLYRKACDLEIAIACSTIGNELANATHGKSPEPADFAKRACDLDTKECDLYGELHRLGWSGLPKDERRATEIYKSACDAGDDFTCVKYGGRLYEGIGTTADKAAADALLQKACDANQAAGCNLIARHLTSAKTDADDARAYKAAQTGCRLKNTDACLEQAWQIEQNRRGAPPIAEKGDRIKEAIAVYEHACTLGSALACNSAGDRYLEGVGVAKDVDKALARFRTACDAETPSGDACLSLADILFSGKLVPKDAKGAFKSAARACARDVESACTWIANAVVEASDMKTAVDEMTPACPGVERACIASANVLLRGTTADKTRGLELLTASCGRKHYPACIRANWALYGGETGEADKAKAERQAGMNCDDGDGASCQQALAMASERKDGNAVLRFGLRGCNQLKYAESCGSVGYAYYVGIAPIDVNMDEATRYDTKACDLGSSMGCANMGEHYRYGLGVAKDPAKAYALYTKACEGGASYGCAGQGHYMRTGEGGAKKDVAAATELLRAACNDRNNEIAEACIETAELLEQQHKGSTSEIAALRDKGIKLTKKYAPANPIYAYWMGTYYRDGVLVAKDAAQARAWFVKACEGADPLGCTAAGQLLAASPVAADRDKAREYFSHACAVKYDEACKGLEDLKKPPPAPPTSPAVVKTKGHGCAASEPSLGALVGLLALGLRRRRR